MLLLVKRRDDREKVIDECRDASRFEMATGMELETRVVQFIAFQVQGQVECWGKMDIGRMAGTLCACETLPTYHGFYEGMSVSVTAPITQSYSAAHYQMEVGMYTTGTICMFIRQPPPDVHLSGRQSLPSSFPFRSTTTTEVERPKTGRVASDGLCQCPLRCVCAAVAQAEDGRERAPR